MRVLVWNMRSGTDRKWPAVRAMRPDVAVLCESARQPKALANPSLGESTLAWEWEGTNVNKGLAIAAWDHRLDRLDTTKPIGRWSIAARFRYRSSPPINVPPINVPPINVPPISVPPISVPPISVLGIWACPLAGGAYSAEVGRSLDAFSDVLDSSDRCIVAGDFNVSGRHPTFDRLRNRLEDAGLVSAYHDVTGDPFGWESAMTWHARHGAERSYHIDFVFLSRSLAESIANLAVLPIDSGPAAGLSDHSPILIDLAEAPR